MSEEKGHNRWQGLTVAVTGASRGLGLGFASFLAAAGANVVCFCRTPSKATSLATLVGKYGEAITVVECDISVAKSVRDAVASLKGRSVDVLINNAGISSRNHPDDPIITADGDEISRVFTTNVIGTIAVTQAFLPLLREGERRLICNLSSQLGSIEDALTAQGRAGGVASYRISRAANNMAARCFAGELAGEGFVCIAMSPGWVQTDMGSSGGRQPPLSVEQSVTGMMDVLSGCESKHNGAFLQYDGKVLPW